MLFLDVSKIKPIQVIYLFFVGLGFKNQMTWQLSLVRTFCLSLGWLRLQGVNVLWEWTTQFPGKTEGVSLYLPMTVSKVVMPFIAL